MAENLMKVPVKGILKNSASFEGPGAPKTHASKGGPKWDEMNILATHHPPDKDYGHMKIDEPKTPYSYDMEDGESGDEADGARKLDSALLRQKLEQDSRRRSVSEAESDLDEEEDEDETPEMKEKRRQFQKRRKDHYNEYMAVQLARKLMEKDEKDEDEGLEDGQNKSSPDDAMEEEDEDLQEAVEAKENLESRKS